MRLRALEPGVSPAPVPVAVELLLDGVEAPALEGAPAPGGTVEPLLLEGAPVLGGTVEPLLLGAVLELEVVLLPLLEGVPISSNSLLKLLPLLS